MAVCRKTALAPMRSAARGCPSRQARPGGSAGVVDRQLGGRPAGRWGFVLAVPDGLLLDLPPIVGVSTATPTLVPPRSPRPTPSPDQRLHGQQRRPSRAPACREARPSPHDGIRCWPSGSLSATRAATARRVMAVVRLVHGLALRLVVDGVGAVPVGREAAAPLGGPWVRAVYRRRLSLPWSPFRVVSHQLAGDPSPPAGGLDQDWREHDSSSSGRLVGRRSRPPLVRS
jgi:hypothetical protein